MPRRAGLEKRNQVHAVFRARNDLRAQLHDHLSHGELLMLQLDSNGFLAPFQHLLENFYQVHERNDEFAFCAFIVVERFIGLRPDVLFDLLFLVEKLRCVFEFFVFDQALD